MRNGSFPPDPDLSPHLALCCLRRRPKIPMDTLRRLQIRRDAQEVNKCQRIDKLFSHAYALANDKAADGLYRFKDPEAVTAAVDALLVSTAGDERYAVMVSGPCLVCVCADEG